MDIVCQSPIVILHPSYEFYVHRFNYICWIDSEFPSKIKFSFIHPRQRSAILSGEKFYRVFPFLPRPNSIDSSKVQNYFFSDLDDSDGEFYPLFLLAPCGKCNCCKSKKINSIVQRCQFACEEFDSLPLFVTLTYNDKHLPECGVNYRDVQLFKKRLNKLVFERFGLHLKYAVFSEYGKLGRAHYHMLIYGLPLFEGKSEYYKFKVYNQLLQFCWRSFPKVGYKRSQRYDFDNFCKQGFKFFNIHNGDKVDPFSNGFVNIQFIRGSGAFRYVSKYVSKGSNVPEGKNPNIFHLSANLGLSFISKYRDFLLSHSYFMFLSKFGSSVFPRKVFLSSYYIKKLFPSQSSLVPIEFRRAWIGLSSLTNQVQHSSLPLWFKSHCVRLCLHVNKLFPNLCYMSYLDPDDSLSKAEQLEFALRQYSTLYESRNCYFEDVIQFLYNYLISFPPDFEDDVGKKVYERSLFLSRLDFPSDTLFTSINYDVKQQFYLSKSIL